MGVTEGALARLSRQQLEAVVAHEFAHILSGSYVTVTLSCLLVGLVACPKCAAPMMRRHYSYEYAVEVDLCARRGLTWFEKDEFEALPILVERQAG